MRFVYILGMLLTLCINLHASPTIGNELWPIAIGNEWTYVVHSTYYGCPNGESKSTILKETTISGRKAFEILGPCSGYGPGYLSVQDDLVDSEYAGSWWRILDTPIEEGHQWQEFRTIAEWKEVGTVSVRAGTFSKCWRKIRKVPYTDWSEYCSGIGMVRSHMVDLSGGFIDVELKAFSLK